MSHSMTKIWIHLIFGTKDRFPIIDPLLAPKLYEHIVKMLETDFECKVKIINGTPDHVHILFLQSHNYSIAEIVKNIKGNSSHWVNQNELIKETFSWQTGYGAFSVSESMILDVMKYIENQKEHHSKISFAEEYKRFEEKYGFARENR